MTKAKDIINTLDELRKPRTSAELELAAQEILTLHKSSPHVDLEYLTREYAAGTEIDFEDLYDVVQSLNME